MQYGTLVRWFGERSYGFIHDDASDSDIFIHVSGFKDKLALPKGTRVQYRIGTRNDKPIALDVESIEAARTAAAHKAINDGFLAAPESGVRQ